MDELSILTQLEQHPNWEVIRINNGLFIGDRDTVAEILELLELTEEDEDGSEDLLEFG